MAHQAILVEKKRDGWLCATLTVHPARHPTFRDYRLITGKTARDAVTDYAHAVGIGDSLPIGCIGSETDGAETGTQGWITLSHEAATARGIAWTGGNSSHASYILHLDTDGLRLDGTADIGRRAFAPTFPGACDIFQRLQDEHGFISRNDVLSDEGVSRLYRMIARCAMDSALVGDPQAIIDKGVSGCDRSCIEVVAYMIDALAAIVGDIALEERLSGVIALVGPRAEALMTRIDWSRFHQLLRDKGEAFEDMRSVRVVLGDQAGAAMRGLASEMVAHLSYELPSSGPVDVEALDKAWSNVGQGPAWAIDRAWRIVHTQNIPWYDHISESVDLKAGTLVATLLHAMDSEGLMAAEPSSRAVLDGLRRGDEVQFQRLGCGGRTITCTATPIPNGGYIVVESDMSDCAETGRDHDDILDLEEAEERLEAVVLASPAVREESGLKILVAEPNLIIRTIIKAMVAQDGHEPVLADSAQGAFDMMNERPDVILCDVELGSPKDLVQRFRRGGKPVMLLAISAQSTSERDALLKDGFDGVLPKPPSHEVFSAFIDKWLGTPQTHASLSRTAAIGR